MGAAPPTPYRFSVEPFWKKARGVRGSAPPTAQVISDTRQVRAQKKGESNRRLTEDALASRAEEGRGTLRKASGSRVQAANRGYPNGETRTGSSPCTATKKQSLGEPGELKHLSTPRKRDDSPSSGERKGNSPNRPQGRGWRALAQRPQAASRRVWEGPPKRVRVP
jgi:hypothetical protein